MRKTEINRIADKLVDEDIFNTEGTLTAEELIFLKENPVFLTKLTDTNYIKKKYILLLFILSVIMMTVAKTIEYTKVISNHEILNNLFTEVLFSISMEILGATFIAYFLEILLDKRMKKNNYLLQQLTDKKINQ